MRHQKLHLIRQDTAITQDEVLPQRWLIRCVKQRHARLLGRAVALAVVARLTRRHHIHPHIGAALAHGANVFAGEF